MPALWRFALPPSLPAASLVESTRALRLALVEALAGAGKGDVDVDVDVVVSRDYDALRLALLTGAADVALAPPAVCAQLSGQIPLPLMCVRRGQTRFCSALVMRHDDDRALGVLRVGGGRAVDGPLRAAWVDPHSACGYLLPRAHLKKLARQHQRADVGVKDGGFFGSYALALGAVTDGHADVAGVHALDGGVGSDEAIDAHLGDGAHRAFRVVAVTDSAPGDGIAAVAGADAVVDAVKALPPDILRRLFRAEAFVPAAPGAWASLL